MQVKKFVGESLPQALQIAKRHLGGEVVLLESREIDGGISRPGQTLVEITVGIDEPTNGKTVKSWNPPKIDTQIGDETPAFAEKNDNFTSLVNEILTKKPVKTDPLPDPESGKPAANRNTAEERIPRKQETRDKEDSKILKELSLLRQEITQLKHSGPKEDKPDYPEMFARSFIELKEKGVQHEVADRFVKRVYRLLGKEKGVGENDIRDALMMEMNQMLTTYTLETDPLNPGKQRVILLLGGTGVGKSTTAMKLAAHPDMFGKQDVAIISVDPYGPSEALKSFSRMNGTTVHEEKNVSELRETINKFKSKDVIIVDTPGKSPFAPNHLDTLESYVKNVNPTDIFLVLGMTSDIKDLYLSCALYLMLKPSGVIFTKFDETTQPGKVFSILDTLKLPVVCFCDGKRIFIDIELAHIEYLYNKIFDENQESSYE